MIIYKITNLINNKVYIGQTIQPLNKRFSQHCTNPKKHFKQAIKKYGKKSFICEEIEKCNTIKELDDREVYWIAFYDSTDRKKGYNFSLGGQKTRKMIRKPRNINKIMGRTKLPIEQLSLGTFEIINIFSSVTEAAKHMKIHPSYITATCQLRQATTSGYIWKFSGVDLTTWKQIYFKTFNSYKKTKTPKIISEFLIKKISLNGKLIKTYTKQEFKSLTRKERQNIIAAINGRNLTALGFKWEREISYKILE